VLTCLFFRGGNQACISPSLRVNLDSLIEGLELASESRPTVDLCDVLFKFTLNFIVYTT
jgi:hypothetical protein